MAPAPTAVHIEIARRLKAARMLFGHSAVNDRGKPRVVPLDARELVQREPLAGDDWTADRIGRIERMERDTKPSELRLLEEALGLPGWFRASDFGAVLAAGAVALARASEDSRAEGPLPSAPRYPKPPR